MRHPERSRGEFIELTLTPPRLDDLIPSQREESRYDFEYRESTEIASAFLHALPIALLLNLVVIYLFWQAIHLF